MRSRIQRTKNQSILENCMFQSKAQGIFFKQRQPCSVGEEVSFRSNHHD